MVRGGATGIWPTELLYDRTGMPYLASGWRRFCQQHGIMPGHLLAFNFDDDHQITVTVFDDEPSDYVGAKLVGGELVHHLALEHGHGMEGGLLS
jgi:hypothetical protein